MNWMHEDAVGRNVQNLLRKRGIIGQDEFLGNIQDIKKIYLNVVQPGCSLRTLKDYLNSALQKEAHHFSHIVTEQTLEDIALMMLDSSE